MVERSTYSKTMSLMFFSLAALLILVVRYRTVGFVGNSLWAEDGPIFFQAAQDRGVVSVFESYASYLNIYPRLFALLMLAIPVALLPYVFCLGWFGTILIVRWAVSKVVVDAEHSEWMTFCAPLFLLLLPHGGETFLNLTNGQWWLAIALALVCSYPKAFGPRSSLIVAILSLTGPFSILFLPVLLVQAYFARAYRIALIVSIGAAVQGWVLVHNPRPVQVLDTNLSDWIMTAKTFVGFGSHSALILLLSSMFWISALFVFFSGRREYRALIACGLLSYAAALLAFKGMPNAISPFGGGQRYFVVPYAMVALAALLHVEFRRGAKLYACIAIVLIFVFSKNKVPQADLNFDLYAKLSQYEHFTRVPLAPVISDAPGFSMIIKNDRPLSSDSISVEVGDPGRIVVGKHVCEGAPGVGVSVDAALEKDGYVAFEWITDGEQAPHSGKIFYRAGQALIQFVFKKQSAPVDVYLVANPSLKPQATGQNKLICL